VGLPGRQPGPQRQQGLAAFEGLNLALLVHREHQRLVRGIEVQAHDIAQLLDEPGVPRELEGVDPMGLQPVLAPDALNRTSAQPLRLRHGAQAPVRGRGRGCGQGRFDDPLHDLWGEGRVAARPRFLVRQRGHAGGREQK
jgi:hypothetical protein